MIRLPVFFVLLLALEACSGSPRNSAPTAPSPVQAANSAFVYSLRSR